MLATRTGCVAALAALLANVSVACADDGMDTGEAGLGQTFARGNCAPCHGVEPSATSSPNTKAPPFVKIAKSEKLTIGAIDGWLTSSHANMPAVSVPTERRADLIAYIRSLQLKP